jgi:dolichol-phosphate mannosyltransferase
MSTPSIDKIPSLSVVVPLYNEDTNILKLYEKLNEHVPHVAEKYEYIFVDDGSRDHTWENMCQLASKDAHVVPLRLSRNFGHQVALTAGLDHVRYDVTVMMDGDLQHPPEVIPRMIELYQKGIDIVYGVRASTENLSFFKRWSSNLYYELMQAMSSVYIPKGSADFRLMSDQSRKALCSLRENHRLLRGMTSWIGFTSAAIYYEQPDRYTGQSSYSLKKMIQLALNGAFSFSTFPLKIIAIFGIGLTFLGFIYLLYVLYQSLIGITTAGWASVISVILLLSGTQLIFLSILGQYIGMIFEQVKRRPLYFLRDSDSDDPESEQQC